MKIDNSFKRIEILYCIWREEMKDRHLKYLEKILYVVGGGKETRNLRIALINAIVMGVKVHIF